MSTALPGSPQHMSARDPRSRPAALRLSPARRADANQCLRRPVPASTSAAANH